MPKLIYIVEDEEDILELIALKLKGAGFETENFVQAQPMLEAVKRQLPDLILLDLMLPDQDGFDVCSILKADPGLDRIPVIMLTARVGVEDRVSGLNLGADDYIAKPFDAQELVARINAVLRRSEWETSKNVLQIAPDLTLDFNRFEAQIKGKRIDLTLTEFKILQLLTKRPGWVYSRSQILDFLWGTDKIVIERSVDVHIRNLREKIGAFAACVQNVRGLGYKFEAPQTW